MPFPILSFALFRSGAFVLLTLVAFGACSPTFNWRDVRPENTSLTLLMPCKPDKAEKTVPFGGTPTLLTLLGCDAGGATFAVAVADLGDAAKVPAVLAQWQSLTLANIKAAPVLAGADSGADGATRVSTLKLPGAAPLPLPVRVQARGQRPDGTRVVGQAAYFAQGSQIFQVVLYADGVTPEVSETFFSSLKFE